MSEISQHSFHPRLLDEFEAANMLRKSVHWLRRMRVRGKSNLIPFRRIGGSIRYEESELIQFIEQAKELPTLKPSIMNI